MGFFIAPLLPLTDGGETWLIRVLFVDDHSIVRKGLRQIVAETDDIVVAAEAVDGIEALHFIDSQAFDAVVLDISLPGRSGLEVLDEIRRTKPSLPVLILSMHPEEHYALRALRSGAAGYLSKVAAPLELIDAIRRISSGRKYVSTSLAEVLVHDLGEPGTKPLHEKLSSREYQILCLIATGKTGKEIAAELNLSAKTVSTYRTRILEKLCLKTTAELTHYALQSKLVP
jgi:DNA-binding NarL/FixJ family response regulator